MNIPVIELNLEHYMIGVILIGHHEVSSVFLISAATLAGACMQGPTSI